MSAGLSSSVPHLTREKDEEDGVEGGGWGGFGECDPRGDAEGSAEEDAAVVACLFRLYRDRNHENGGNYVFGDSWASRFLARHNLRRRVATTKMRERPADFAKKIADYIRIAASIICMYGIPPELVIGCDETGCVFVPRSKHTIAC